MQFVCIYEDPFGKLIWILFVGEPHSMQFQYPQSVTCSLPVVCNQQSAGVRSCFVEKVNKPLVRCIRLLITE